jgi:hypothetical protein
MVNRKPADAERKTFDTSERRGRSAKAPGAVDAR